MTPSLKGLGRTSRTAITITAKPGQNVLYTQALILTRSKIDLAEIEVQKIYSKRTMTKDVIFEIHPAQNS